MATKSYNPLYWSAPLMIGLGALGGAIFHFSYTARMYAPKVDQAIAAANNAAQAANNAAQKAGEIAKNAPQIAHDSGVNGGKGFVEGAGRTLTQPQTIVTDQLPDGLQLLIDPAGAVTKRIDNLGNAADDAGKAVGKAAEDAGKAVSDATDWAKKHLSLF